MFSLRGTSENLNLRTVMGIQRLMNMSQLNSMRLPNMLTKWRESNSNSSRIWWDLLIWRFRSMLIPNSLRCHRTNLLLIIMMSRSRAKCKLLSRLKLNGGSRKMGCSQRGMKIHLIKLYQFSHRLSSSNRPFRKSMLIVVNQTYLRRSQLPHWTICVVQQVGKRLQAATYPASQQT